MGYSININVHVHFVGRYYIPAGDFEMEIVLKLISKIEWGRSFPLLYLEPHT